MDRASGPCDVPSVVTPSLETAPGTRASQRVLDRKEAETLESILAHLSPRLADIQMRWKAGVPFRYAVIDDFLPSEMAEAILAAYPEPDVEGWNRKTYIHQRKKFTLRSNFPEPIDNFFTAAEAPEFTDIVSRITGIPNLLPDPELFGGGLHQILRDGYLDVHVDYNFHPETRLHRRLNLLLYMNKDWRRDYEGYLELWDMESRKLLELVAPFFNRAVIFETNEISYHGHPVPLKTPQHIARKSIALYFYTRERPDAAPEHNTMHVQTSGLRGRLKNVATAADVFLERLESDGVVPIGQAVLRKLSRKFRGLPPENG